MVQHSEQLQLVLGVLGSGKETRNLGHVKCRKGNAVNEELQKPERFYSSLRTKLEAVTDSTELTGEDLTRRTKRFTQLMHDISIENGYYCQNYLKKEMPKREEGTSEKEWMNIDHVFVGADKPYDEFPFIVVEHENGGFGSEKEDCDVKLASPNKTKAPIEWAFWKCLTMRAKLNVLVAYPRENDRWFARSVLERIAGGWYRTYPGQELNSLVLFGWSDHKGLVKNAGPDMYEPFVVRLGASLRKLA